ncbi:hypothetical protein SISSUDRAFT_714927 [Sistotremastrum suecicum HHB10207 ss-3]|uniref:Uncharacterized protein n=1 Tax=Sistotremastrum suecicum HHB10207 ss-3 TaxID=1314776 RepID=A0A166DPL3_9AGAM|nr:hypothetical protein SISSUDRAFT_714927 [Sistotremastrum suecicum HHB10207 ss-3]
MTQCVFSPLCLLNIFLFVILGAGSPFVHFPFSQSSPFFLVILGAGSPFVYFSFFQSSHQNAHRSLHKHLPLPSLIHRHWHSREPPSSRFKIFFPRSESKSESESKFALTQRRPRSARKLKPKPRPSNT